MDGSAPRVRLLGQVTLLDTNRRPVEVGGPLVRAFLALLAIEAPHAVALDTLLTMLWGEDLPGDPRGALQQIASRLRRAVAGDREIVIEPISRGYALRIDPDLIDVHRFRSMVRIGLQHRASGRQTEAARTFTRGLSLWSGPALADLAHLPLAARLASVIDGERWRAEEARAAALLACGRAEECADVLVDATAQAPLEERLWVLRTRALMESGRRVEALRCCRTAAGVIDAELGVPPGPELLELERTLRTEDAGGLREGVAATWRTTADITALRHQLADPALRKALVEAERAAVDAAAVEAWHEAVRHWQRALSLHATIEPGDGRSRLRILLGLGHAHDGASVAEEARVTFREAITQAREIRDRIGFIHAVLGYCSDRVSFSPDDESRSLLAEALAATRSNEHPLRGRLLSLLAITRYWANHPAATRSLAGAALAEASRIDDVDSRLLANEAQVYGRWVPDGARDLLATAESYLSTAITAGSLRHELLARRWIVQATLQLGDLPRGRRETDRCLDLGKHPGLAPQQWIVRLLAAVERLMSGDLAAAESTVVDALALGAVTEPDVAFDYTTIFFWTLRWLQGRLDEVAVMAEDLTALPGVTTARRLGLAVTFGEAGDPSRARDILDDVIGRGADVIPRDGAWTIAMSALAEAAVLTNHHDGAAEVYRLLAPMDEEIAVTPATSTGPLSHFRGICAWQLGRHAEALALLTRAVTQADACDMPVFAARSRAALAERLAVSGGHAEAEEHASLALEEAQRRGLVGVERSARATLGC